MQYSNLIKYKSGDAYTYVTLPNTSNLLKRFLESGTLLSAFYPSEGNDGSKEYNPFSKSYVGDDKVGELLQEMYESTLPTKPKKSTKSGSSIGEAGEPTVEAIKAEPTVATVEPTIESKTEAEKEYVWETEKTEHQKSNESKNTDSENNKGKKGVK